MELPWLGISVAVNIVQAFLLFFKSAINDILKRCFASWYDARERRKSLLRQLYSEIELLPNYYFLWLTGGMIYEYGKSPEERDQGKEMTNRNFTDVERILGFIRSNRLDFPSSIQAALEELTKAARAGDVVFAETGGFKVLSKQIDDVGVATQRIRSAIRAELD